jgi:hypothetical protein
MMSNGVLTENERSGVLTFTAVTAAVAGFGPELQPGRDARFRVRKAAALYRTIANIN